MSNIVNLNRARKRSAREAAEKEAEANRVKFGRSKAERASDEDRTRRLDGVLDQHRIEREGGQ